MQINEMRAILFIESVRAAASKSNNYKGIYKNLQITPKLQNDIDIQYIPAVEKQTAMAK